MVGLRYDYRFHTRVAQGNYKSRIRIYSINLAQNPIDVSNIPEVEEYGDLLIYKNTDTDSNGRIGQNGIKINNYFNKDEQIEIGNAASCNIELSLINDDGYFSTYDWTQTIIIYWDVWEELNQGWLTCPLGIYWWERPTRTSDVVVVAKANDAMSAIFENRIPGISFPSEDDARWENGIRLYEFYNQIVSNIPGVIPDASIQYVPNMTTLYHSAPFDASSMTRKEVLAWMAGVCGGIAQISRDGKPRIRFFKDAFYQEFPLGPKYYYTLDGDSGPSPIVSISIGEYTIPQINKLIAMVGQSNKTYLSGTGSNGLYSINNGFLVNSDATAQAMVDTMYSVVSGQDASSDIVPYTPIALKAYFDPSVESGDIIRVVRGGVTYPMPIFQQILRWNGAEWTAELQSSGLDARQLPSDIERQGFRTTAAVETTIKTAAASATVDENGRITFINALGATLFTIQLPLPTIETRENSEPYLSRPMPFATGLESLDKIIGGTVVWNQLVQNGNFQSADKWSGSGNASLSVSDNVMTVHKDSGTGITGGVFVTSNARQKSVAGHKYLICFTIQTINGNVNSFPTGTSSEGNTGYIAYPNKTAKAWIWNCQVSKSMSLELRGYTGSGVTSAIDFTVENYMCFDLTAMFGSTIADYIYSLEQANAGDGVAWFKNLFNGSYYPYDSGTLLSVKTSAHITEMSYPLDDNIELRGIPKLNANNKLYYDGDEYEPDGSVTRKYGLKNLGTLSWYKPTATDYMTFYANGIESLVELPTDDPSSASIIRCSKYGTYPSENASTLDKYIYITPSGQVRVKDTDNASLTADGFKTLMQGVYLVYKLATATTETADPYTKIQKCDKDGTEEFEDTRAVGMPVGHSTTYFVNSY